MPCFRVGLIRVGLGIFGMASFPTESHQLKPTQLRATFFYQAFLWHLTKSYLSPFCASNALLLILRASGSSRRCDPSAGVRRRRRARGSSTYARHNGLPARHHALAAGPARLSPAEWNRQGKYTTKPLAPYLFFKGSYCVVLLTAKDVMREIDAVKLTLLGGLKYVKLRSTAVFRTHAHRIKRMWYSAVDTEKV